VELICNQYNEVCHKAMNLYFWEKTMICLCNQVSEKEIRRLIRKHQNANFEDVQQLTRAGTSCGRCKESVKNIVRDEQTKHPTLQLRLF
jgi:bacterioferritin-associated ferredoxin